MDREYKAFISYRHLPTDMETAKMLHRRIERYTVLKELRADGQKHLGRVFRDQDELPLSGNLSESIQNALDHSEYLIVVCTPETQNSMWVINEITYFIRRHGRDHVLAVLADGTQKTSFPKELTVVSDDDGNPMSYIEPLAANIAADSPAGRKKLFRTESLRILAALIGCNYDDLYKREQRYRRRKIGSILIAALLVICCFFAMLLNRNRVIEEQLQIALRNESDALTAQSQKEYSDGNIRGAVEYALQALPEPGRDRPYLPAAEEQLTSALGLYRTERFCFLQTLQQDTNIRGLSVSDHGSYAVTSDLFNTLRVFRCESGQLLWQQTYKSLDCFGFAPDSRSLLISGTAEDGSVYSVLDRLSLPDCVLTEQTGPDGYYLAINADGSGHYVVSNSRGFSLFRMNDGKQITSVPIPESRDLTGGSCWSVSENGRYFSVLTSEFDSDSGTFSYLLLIADLADGTSELLPVEAEYDVLGSFRLAFDGEDLALGYDGTQASKIFVFEKKERWQLRFCRDFSSGDLHYVNGDISISGKLALFSAADHVLYFGAKSYICSIDITTGAVLGERNLLYDIQGARLLDNSVVALVLSNGLVTFYQKNGVLTSDLGMYSFLLEGTLYGGAVSAGSAKTATYAVIYTDHKNRAAVIRYSGEDTRAHLFETETGRNNDFEFVLSADQRVMAGYAYHSDEKQLDVIVIDPSGAAASETFSICLDYPMYHVTPGTVFVTPDKQLVLGGISVDLTDGSVTDLLSDGTDAGTGYEKFRSACDRKTGSVVTAWADPGEGCLYIRQSNNSKPLAAGLPTFLPDPNSLSSRCEAVSASGTVLVSSEDDTFSLAAYSAAQNSWIAIDSTDIFHTSYSKHNYFAVSEDGNRLAMLTRSDELLLVDAADGTRLLTVPYPMPAESVGTMVFSDEDRLLFVFNSYGILNIYDTASGVLVYEKSYADTLPQFSSDSRYEILRAKNGGRLLLICKDPSYRESVCIIIDTDNWASLGCYLDISGYLREQDRLILAPPFGKALSLIPLYSTEDVVQQARAYLDRE